MSRLRIGTRGSALALAQTQLVSDLLGGCDIVTVTTTGDRDASGRFPAASVFGRVERRIIEIAEKLREAEGHLVAEAAEAIEEATTGEGREAGSARRR